MSYTAPRLPVGYQAGMIGRGSSPYPTVGAVPSTAVWPSANLAIYIPLLVSGRGIVRELGVGVQTSSGNIDVGVYDAGGTRLVSTGSTAVGTTGWHMYDVTDTTIGPGLYYFGIAVDNTTAAFSRYSVVGPQLAASGIYVQTSAFALPATATFAIDSTHTYWPVVSMLFDPVL